MEWTTVTVIIALVGLIAAVAGPLIKLNTIITRLAVIVDELGKQMNGFVDKNSEAHGRLWDKLDVLLLNGRLTDEQYTELIGMMGGTK